MNKRKIGLWLLLLVALAEAQIVIAAVRFTDNGNGTVSDNVTGLMWQREDDDVARNWQGVLAYCEDLSLGGHDDWRLPDIKELRSIVDNTVANPSINATAFPNTSPAGYWSSTTSAGFATNAWYVLFNVGYASYGGGLKTDSKYARCVR